MRTLFTWEVLDFGDDEEAPLVSRFRLPHGWIYRVDDGEHVSTVWVPDP